MTDHDREAFETWVKAEDCSIERDHAGYFAFGTALAYRCWQAARDHYAPKLTEKEAIELGAKAAYNFVFVDGNKWPRCDGGRIRPEEFRLATKAALRAAGVRFKDET